MKSRIAILLVCFVGGCAEVVTEGFVSDRHTASAIQDVEISTSRESGWKKVGATDSGGRYFIFKHDLKSGASVQLKKPGYYTVVMPGSEFLGVNSHLMTPTGEAVTPEDRDAGSTIQENSDPLR